MGLSMKNQWGPWAKGVDRVGAKKIPMGHWARELIEDLRTELRDHVGAGW